MSISPLKPPSRSSQPAKAPPRPPRKPVAARVRDQALPVEAMPAPVPAGEPPAGMAHPEASSVTVPIPAPVRGRPRKSALEPDEGNRRRQIIDSAARLFRSKGFDAASTRDIAAAAGMHSGSPFYHFESKHALLYVVMQEGMQHALASQRAALAQLAPGTPARAQFRTLVRNHFEVLLGTHADFTPVMLYEWRSLDAAESTVIAALKDAYESEWMPVLHALHAEGALQATPAVARLFMFGALNWSVQWFNPQGALSFDALTDQAVALFLGKR